MGKRSKARECALQMLYQWDLTREPIDQVIEAFWRVRSGTQTAREMAERLARGAQGELARIDAAIDAQLEHWRPERVATLDRNLLRLGTYELMSEPTPASVVIDEAVEMAKRFGEQDSPAFVNGVLDAVKRSLREPPGAKRSPAGAGTGQDGR